MNSDGDQANELAVGDNVGLILIAFVVLSIPLGTVHKHL